MEGTLLLSSCSMVRLYSAGGTSSQGFPAFYTKYRLKERSQTGVYLHPNNHAFLYLIMNFVKCLLSDSPRSHL